jgi:two-component system cell cycle sensor histidine kinase/response regulator CckA
MAPILKRLIQEDIAISVESAHDIGYVRADRSQMEQIILNLVLNARDAMRDGGDLKIRTDNVTLSDADASRSGHPAGHYVRLQVQDTGVGMDAPTRAHIFEPFFTTKDVGQGTGLGLSTVLGVVDQSGGWIDVASAPGEGSTFSVFLPRVTVPESY